MKVVFKEYIFIHVPMPQIPIPVFKHSLLFPFYSFKELPIFLLTVANTAVEESD